MQVNAFETPTLVAESDLSDGMIVVRYDSETGEIKGKGAKREWRNGDVVTTENMVASFKRDQYVVDGYALVIGTLKPSSETAEQVREVAASGRTSEVVVTKRGPGRPRKDGKPKANDVVVGTATSTDYDSVIFALGTGTFTAQQRLAIARLALK